MRPDNNDDGNSSDKDNSKFDNNGGNRDSNAEDLGKRTSDMLSKNKEYYNSEDLEHENKALLQKLATQNPDTRVSTLGDFCKKDDEGWVVYGGVQAGEADAERSGTESSEGVRDNERNSYDKHITQA